MRAQWRVYILPFDDFGNYGDSWVEVTDDVVQNGIGSITTDLDNTEYDIGVFRTSNFTIKLNNSEGLYSDVGSPQSIFKYTRSNSLVRVTHTIDNPTCGFSVCGESYLSDEVEVFKGLLNDESLSMDLDKQEVSLTCLGRESVFKNVIVPFGTVSNGDLASTVIYNCLNRPEITRILNVSLANITPGLDQAIDSIASLQNQTVQEGLNNLLFSSNSVLWIDGDDVKVSSRAETADVQYTFYGQASPNGAENILSIKAIKSGLTKVFNFITWADSTYFSKDDSSVEKYGARKKEITFEFFTDSTKIQNILTAIKNEFQLPKQEFDLYTPLTLETMNLKRLSKVSIDYPNIAFAGANPLPLFGFAKAGEAVAPKVLWSFSVDPLDYYKVMGRSLDLNAQVVKFKMRKT